MVKFEEYEKMIMDKAFKVSKQYHVDFDDMVSVGYEIYVNSLKSYDEKKGAKFGTYLFIQLNGIADEAKRLCKKKCAQFSSLCEDGEEYHFEDSIESVDYNLNNKSLFDVAKEELSYEAYSLFKWITSFSWQDRTKIRVATVPTKRMAIAGCGFTKDVVESAWSECESFWNKFGVSA